MDDMREKVIKAVNRASLLVGADADVVADAAIAVIWPLAMEAAAGVADEWASKVDYDGGSLASVQVHGIAAALRNMGVPTK